VVGLLESDDHEAAARLFVDTIAFGPGASPITTRVTRDLFHVGFEWSRLARLVALLAGAVGDPARTLLDLPLLAGEEGLDLALVPSGDNYTMGPEDAVRAVGLLQPRTVVPIHYNTWELIAQDAAAWADRVRKETKAEPVVLKPGEWVTV